MNLKNTNKMLLVKLCLVFFSVLLLHHSFAANVYKWTDENGQIHYSSSVPQQQKTESVGVTNNNPNAQSTSTSKDTRCNKSGRKELIVGNWISKTSNKVSIRFSKNRISGHKSPRTVQKYSISVNNRQLQSGLWVLTGDNFKLTITNRGRVRTRFSIVNKARIVSFSLNELILVINKNKRMQFKRYTGSGNVPKCMRKKRRKRR